jgi:hypothetical protein
MTLEVLMALNALKQSLVSGRELPTFQRSILLPASGYHQAGGNMFPEDRSIKKKAKF